MVVETRRFGYQRANASFIVWQKQLLLLPYLSLSLSSFSISIVTLPLLDTSLRSAAVTTATLILLFMAGVGASQCSLLLVVKFSVEYIGNPSYLWMCPKTNHGYLVQLIVAQQIVVYRCTWAEWVTPVSVVSMSGLNSVLTES
ncbi:hypothetical protein QVD17_00490 [Tagetes erecta]|uniref:Uncharacterized protein n=1 Tax=Tagetes erecta TaxID=13708 RepID=A0AAD8LBP3_TARER|nr:hypothetical protein QVD17_00490 [Tagetes erecta]